MKLCSFMIVEAHIFRSIHNPDSAETVVIPKVCRERPKPIWLAILAAVITFKNYVDLNHKIQRIYTVITLSKSHQNSSIRGISRSISIVYLLLPKTLTSAALTVAAAFSQSFFDSAVLTAIRILGLGSAISWPCRCLARESITPWAKASSTTC